VSFAAIILCITSHPVFIFVVYFVIDLVRKISDTPSYVDVSGQLQVLAALNAVGNKCVILLKESPCVRDVISLLCTQRGRMSDLIRLTLMEVRTGHIDIFTYILGLHLDRITSRDGTE
jgi:hypothetical protein